MDYWILFSIDWGSVERVYCYDYKLQIQVKDLNKYYLINFVPNYVVKSDLF